MSLCAARSTVWELQHRASQLPLAHQLEEMGAVSLSCIDADPSLLFKLPGRLLRPETVQFHALVIICLGTAPHLCGLLHTRNATTNAYVTLFLPPFCHTSSLAYGHKFHHRFHVVETWPFAIFHIRNAANIARWPGKQCEEIRLTSTHCGDVLTSIEIHAIVPCSSACSRVQRPFGPFGFESIATHGCSGPGFGRTSRNATQRARIRSRLFPVQSPPNIESAATPIGSQVDHSALPLL